MNRIIRTITFTTAIIVTVSAVLVIGLPLFWHAYYTKIIEHVIGPMRPDQEWRKLAEGGDPTAQSEQCSMYGFKKDVDPDYYRKIVTWCRDDAEKGSISSESLLAKLYESGKGGLSQSWEDAYFWYAVRVTDAHIPTTERDEAKKHLTDQQVKLVDEQIANWREKLCASHPTERNAKVMREWHCGP